MDAPPLVGRADEQRALADALGECRAGRGGLVLVGGEAGVGKSRLVAEALDIWSGRVLRVAATPGAGAHAPLLGLSAATGGAGPPPEFGEEPERAATTLAGRAAAGGPAVLVIDDLHLADTATLDALPPTAAVLEGHPVLVVGLYRNDGLARTHPLRRARAELRRARRLREVVLAPLEPSGTAALLAHLLGATPTARLAALVHTRADGLPFYVEELAAALGEAGVLVATAEGALDLPRDTHLPLPETVLDATLARTADLRERHREAVECAAVLGDHVDLAVLADLAGGDEADVLVEAGLLVEQEAGRAAFRHALVREALHGSVPWNRRRALHARAAEALHARGAAPGIVAEQWLAAHEPRRARPLLLAAAEQHCAEHAYRDSAALLTRALATWPEGEDADERVRVQEELADCAELGGNTAGAQELWARLAGLHRRAGDLARAGAAHVREANAADLVGDLGRAAAARRAAVADLTRAGDTAEATAVRLTLAEHLKSAGRLSEALAEATTATETARSLARRDLQARALALQGALRSAAGQGSQGVELARSGLELALEPGQPPGAAGGAWYELAEALEYAADYAAAADAYRSAYEVCRDRGEDELAGICYVCISPATRLLGDWDRVLAVCGEVLADQEAAPVARAVAEEESGLVLALRGDRRRAAGRLRRSADFAVAAGVMGLEIGALWGLAVVARLEGDRSVARGRIDVLLERCGATEESHYSLPALRWAVSVLADEGRAVEAAACHRLLAAHATRNGSAKVLSALAHARAELSGLDGDHAAAAAQLARSVDLLAGIRSPYETAHTQVRRAAACLRAGDRAAALAAAETGYAVAHRLGARPLAREAARVVAELGEPVAPTLGRTAERVLAGDLTRREREVLAHLAEGRTNREIAATLYLSTRTVDMHVRHVLAKLGCTSRTAAVRRATEAGLLPSAAASAVAEHGKEVLETR